MVQLKLKSVLSDLVSLPPGKLPQAVSCPSLEADCMLLFANLAMKGFASVPCSESLIDEATTRGHLTTEWKLGFQLNITISPVLPGSLGAVFASK